MEALFTKDYYLLWAILLALALFLPVRQLIWVLYVRRAERDGSETDDETRARLKRRSTVTSALLCFLFAVAYSSFLFQP